MSNAARWSAAVNGRVVFQKVAKLPEHKWTGPHGVMVHGFRTSGGWVGLTGASWKQNGDCKQCEVMFANVYLPAYKTRNLNQAALHEIGHVLGIRHSTSAEAPSVMLPSGGSKNLEAIDIFHVRELYP